jgi:carboxypeptidase family protein
MEKPRGFCALGWKQAGVVGIIQLLVPTTAIAAQQLYGSLVGNVVDSTGAVLPGATVTATQLETNLTREVVTNTTGAYSIANIPSGTYQVVVTVPGFQHFIAKNITVNNRETRVDAIRLIAESPANHRIAPRLGAAGSLA